MGKTSADGLRLIDTDKFFASLEGRLDDKAFARIAAAFSEACGRGGISFVLGRTHLAKSELSAARKDLCRNR